MRSRGRSIAASFLTRALALATLASGTAAAQQPSRGARLVGGGRGRRWRARGRGGRPRAGEDEVAPVMRALEEGGVEVAALHNHVLHESPRVMHLQIHSALDQVAVKTSARVARQ